MKHNGLGFLVDQVGFDHVLRILTVILNEQILQAKQNSDQHIVSLNMHRIEKLRELIDPTVKPTLEDMSKCPGCKPTVTIEDLTKDLDQYCQVCVKLLREPIRIVGSGKRYPESNIS